MDNHVFCTSLAESSLAKFYSLLVSIKKNLSEEVDFWIFCETKLVLETINNWEFSNLKTFHFNDLERVDLELYAVKDKRDPFEYNCTLRPSLILYVLNNAKNKSVTYLDTDLFFFNDPAFLYKELEFVSVLLSQHRISMLSKLTGIDTNTVGLFNAGWIVFKNDIESRKLLYWWRESCLNWCSRYPIPGKFGEQKYLDEFPKISNKIKIIDHLGVNVAPWNVTDINIWQSSSKMLMANDVPLIFFHFHSLKIPGEKSFKVDFEIGKDYFQLANPNYLITKHLKKILYEPYLNVLIPATYLAHNFTPLTPTINNLLCSLLLKKSIKSKIVSLRSYYYHITLKLKKFFK